MAYEYVPWPAWRYGPNGARAIFKRPEDVPAGWVDTPAKLVEAAPVEAPDAAPAPAPAAEPMKRPRGRPRKVV